MKLEYAVRIERSADSDGGGYLATVPEGETLEQALKKVQEAIASWIAAANKWKMDIPRPSPPMVRAG